MEESIHIIIVIRVNGGTTGAWIPNPMHRNAWLGRPNMGSPSPMTLRQRLHCRYLHLSPPSLRFDSKLRSRHDHSDSDHATCTKNPCSGIASSCLIRRNVSSVK